MNDLSLGIAFGSFLLENDEAIARMADGFIQVSFKLCRRSAPIEEIVRDTCLMPRELYSSGWTHGLPV